MKDKELQMILNQKVSGNMSGVGSRILLQDSAVLFSVIISIVIRLIYGFDAFSLIALLMLVTPLVLIMVILLLADRFWKNKGGKRRQILFWIAFSVLLSLNVIFVLSENGIYLLR